MSGSGGRDIRCDLCARHKLCLAKVMGTFVLGLAYDFYGNWGALHHDVVDIQAPFEPGDRSKDRSRPVQGRRVSALITL